MCIYMHMHTCIMKARGQQYVPLLISRLFFESHSLTESGAHQLVSLADQGTTRILLLSPF